MSEGIFYIKIVTFVLCPCPAPPLSEKKTMTRDYTTLSQVRLRLGFPFFRKKISILEME